MWGGKEYDAQQEARLKPGTCGLRDKCLSTLATVTEPFFILKTNHNSCMRLIFPAGWVGLTSYNLCTNRPVQD